MRAEVLEKVLLLSSGSEETLPQVRINSCARVALTSSLGIQTAPTGQWQVLRPPCKPSRDDPPIRHLGPIIFFAHAGRADPVVPASFLALTPNN